MLTRTFVLLCLACGLTACASRNPAQWHEETGFGVCPSWRTPRVGREMARRAAIGEAREKIMAAVFELEVDGRTRVEDLAAVDPRFLSKLRGIVASLTPADMSDKDEATIAVEMRIDKNEVLTLARKHLARIAR